MRAVTFDVSVPRYLLAKSFGRLSDMVLYGTPSGVSLRDVKESPLPGPRLGAIGDGTRGNLWKRYREPELLGESRDGALRILPSRNRPRDLGACARGGKRRTWSRAGQRVAVDPMISCAARGWGRAEWCASCMEGLPSTCENAGEEGPQTVAGEPMAPGLTIGYHRSLPGGWGERLIAHESQLHPLPDELSDRTAVLIEPLSIGVHAVLNCPPREGEPVLVIGSGPIALATVWALRALGFKGEVVAQTKRSHEAESARAMGASSVVAPGKRGTLGARADGGSGLHADRGAGGLLRGWFPTRVRLRGKQLKHRPVS